LGADSPSDMRGLSTESFHGLRMAAAVLLAGVAVLLGRRQGQEKNGILEVPCAMRLFSFFLFPMPAVAEIGQMLPSHPLLSTVTALMSKGSVCL